MRSEGGRELGQTWLMTGGTRASVPGGTLPEEKQGTDGAGLGGGLIQCCAAS
jgi:hypothetical protein